MSKKFARYSATNENLLKYSLAPTMRWLIATALDGSTMTYGEIKGRLEGEGDFSTIFATRIGYVAGALMNHIQETDPDAPLINVLVVNQNERLPSKGAGSFMATRFGNARLARHDYKEKHPGKWREYFEAAAAEVYAYSSEQWSELYQSVFGEQLSESQVDALRSDRHDGNEVDFGSGSGKYGAGGESNHHRNLRLWVEANPRAIRREFSQARTETEVELDSGDRVDVVYHLPQRTIVLEVKSRISNGVDIRRGIFQCIKYRAVKAAMDVRDEVPVEAFLVTEGDISGEMKALLRVHGIKHHNVGLDRE